MSILLKGISVSKGIYIGKAVLISKDDISYAPSFIKKSQIKNEQSQYVQHVLSSILTASKLALTLTQMMLYLIY